MIKPNFNLSALALLAAAWAPLPSAAAQAADPAATYPNRPVRFIAPFVPGGLRAPDVAKRLASDGSTPVGSRPEQFDVHIKTEIAKWRKLAQEANLQLQQ